MPTKAFPRPHGPPCQRWLQLQDRWWCPDGHFLSPQQVSTTPRSPSDYRPFYSPRRRETAAYSSERTAVLAMGLLLGSKEYCNIDYRELTFPGIGVTFKGGPGAHPDIMPTVWSNLISGKTLHPKVTIKQLGPRNLASRFSKFLFSGGKSCFPIRLSLDP